MRNNTVLAHYHRYIGAFSIIGGIGGFVADVLQPLAPVSLFVLIASIAATLILLMTILLLRAWRARLLPHLILSLSFMLFSGAFLAFQNGEAKTTGVLAENFPAISALQSQLGLIQQDIAAIKEATEKTAESAAKIEESSAKTAEATSKIAKSLEDMQQGFASLTKTGGIIATAASAEEHYHNARVYETRGDYGNARKSYNQLLTFKLDFLDPHLRYQAFLKLQEGVAGAREIYAGIVESNRRPVTELAALLLVDEGQRAGKLQAFAAANPDMAPAFYELSREFSAARKGTQSLADKRAEHAALTTLMQLHGEGKLIKYFIDKEVAAKWIEDAETRLQALASAGIAGAAVPVSLLASRTGSDWIVSLQLLETPKEIFYRLEGEEQFRSTGSSQVKNPTTGAAMPNMYFNLKADTPKSVIEVKYTDIGGALQGPYALGFDPEEALFAFQKSTLAMTKNSWVAFRDYDGWVLLYFTHLLISRCALARIDYGLNSEATPNRFDLPACDRKNPYNVPEDGKIYIEVPGDSKFVSVKLTFADNSTSEVVRFDR